MLEAARKYALQNAVAHGGKANAKAVASRLLALDASLRPKAREVQIEVDRVVTGCDRGAMLETYAAFAEELRVKRDDGAVTGYGGRWRHGELHVIGPVIAADTDAAIALSADLASRANGEVRIEVGDERAELAAWANATGLVRSATTSVMTLGGRPLPGDRDRWFMPVTLAIG